MAKTITYITTLTLLLALAAGCRRTATPTPFTDAERAAVDSMLRPATTVDSLLTMIDRFALDGNQLGQIVAYRQLGKLYREQNHFDRAIDCHNRSINLALACADTMELIQAYNNIGTNYRRMSEHDEASRFHILAARLSNEIADQDNPATLKNKVVSLNGLGNVYLSIGMLEMADSVLRMALDGERRLGSALGQAINMANLGAIKEQLGQTDSAWFYYRQSLRFNEEAASTLGLSLCHSHFGELYEREGRLDEALDEYRTAYQLMAGSPDDWHRLESGLNIVRIYIRQGRYAEALRHLNTARETAQRSGSMEHRAEVESLYADLYEKMGQTRLALDHYKTARTLSDSVINLQTVNQIQNMSLNLERSRRQHELRMAEQDLQLERSARRLILMTAILILLLAAGIIAFMWYHYRARLNRQHMMQQMQQTREAFFTNITHEFRTPLTVILGLGQQLEDQDIDDMSQVRSSAKMIVRQGNSLLGLINQLLDISKVRSAIGQPKWRHADIIAYITMIVENFRPYADSKRQELTFTHSLTALKMDFVPDYVQRIVTNLVANAIKYTPTYGRINVTFEQSGQSRVKLQVFDTGQGIPASDLPHIFDAFFQGENHGGDIGTGIGLSLVRVMTEAMNGTVSATSIPGQGSTFTVLLPLHADRRHQPVDATDRQPTLTSLPYHMGDDPQPDPDAPADPPADPQAPEQRRILIVEDNQDIAFYIGMHLQADSQLLYAHTGEEGLKKAREVVPDLIITDIMMPGDMNGLELCRRIRSDELLSHIPIIIITAKTTEADRVSGLQAGADAYLVKPFNSDELLVRVSKLMERQRLMRQRYAQTADADAPASDDNLTAADRQWMNRLVDTVYRLMAKGTVDMETIAGEMAISRAQMNRKLLALTGQNASAYIMRLRLARAKRLLKGDSTMPVGDVALRCGFDDVAYFSRVFKQTFEMTPSQYRRNI